MKAKKRPEIGTKMYSVHEHRYYVEGRTAPVLEYCVCEAEVKSFFTGGFTEVRLVGNDPNGHRTPYSYPIAEIGEKLFYTPREAAEHAKTLTEKYENTWKTMDGRPMRRTWEKFLSQEREEHA